jgi:predicted dithiol-disulfide oxidoreductase (DUF899 family)
MQAQRIVMKTKYKSEIGLPKIVTQAEWQKAVAALLEKEKEATHARDALAAERRRLPMVRIDKNYVFVAPAGKVSLFDLFEGRRQLIEALGSVWTFLDLTPLGRQENWEDSPVDRPQTAPYTWWRRHDEYDPSAHTPPR